MEIVPPSKAEALSTLMKLITTGNTREQRLKTLLRSPEKADANWFMYLPICFNNALDIRRTVRVGAASPVWTQGANFSFGAGDTVYDSNSAYDEWGRVLQNGGRCFQVAKATAVSPPSAGAARSAGSVTFTLSKPNESRTALEIVETHTVTQDDFVRFLIVGFPDQLLLE